MFWPETGPAHNPLAGPGFLGHLRLQDARGAAPGLNPPAACDVSKDTKNITWPAPQRWQVHGTDDRIAF